MLSISEIFVLKDTSSTGTVSIKFVASAGKKQYSLFINELILNKNNTIEPISYYKNNSIQLITGDYFDFLRRNIVKIFNDVIYGDEIGFFSWNSIDKRVKKG